MRGVSTKVVLMTGLITAVLAAAWWASANLDSEPEANPLQDAMVALSEGDEAGYEHAVAAVAAEGARVPELFRTALYARDTDLLSTGAAMLASGDADLYEVALSAIAEEQALLPDRPAAGLPPQPGSSQAPPGRPSPEAFAVDQMGRAVLDQLDYRQLPVPESARQVLALPPARGSLADVPRPVTYETARREIREHLDTIPTAGLLSTSSLRTLGLIAAVVGILAWAAVRSWGRRHNRLVEMATIDGLTGLMNRRQLDADLDEHLDRGPAPTALLMIDVDHFKAFNDAYGHSTGDDVLKRVAATISTNVREDDIAYRYGGEEFCVLLPNAYILDALRVAERVRDSIEAIDLPVAAHVTASVGVASGSAEDVMDVVREADIALLAAKSQGRNRVVVA